MPDSDEFQVTFIQSLHGTRFTNVFYVQQQGSDPVGKTQLDDIADAFIADVVPHYQSALSNAWTGICVEVSKERVTGQAFFQKAMTAVGDVNSDSLNAATVATIAAFTATGGRRGTGRAFVSGLPLEYEQRNNLTTEGVDALRPLSDALVQGVTGVGPLYLFGRQARWETPEQGPAAEIYPFDEWTTADTRIPLTKLRSRRQSAKC